MKPRLLIVCWLGLLLPTLVAGGLLYSLLRNEEVRLVQADRAAAAGQARIMADQVALTVSDLRQQVLDGVTDIPADHLLEWLDQYPLARNVFVWSEDGNLLIPEASNGLTEEERHFIERYEPLFSGRQPWEASAPPDGPPAQSTQSVYGQQEYSPNRELRSLNWSARRRVVDQQKDEREMASRTGWIPWFAGDHLYMLGWVHDAGRGQYKGVELEMAALISRVLTVLPEEVPPGTSFALRDGNGRIVFQRGWREVTIAMKPTASEPIGPELPHWSVSVYADGNSSIVSGRLFAVLSMLIAGSFVVAIIASGTLLLWHARRNLLDARRKTTFVSNVSHELKTPLTTIRMYAEMLGEGRVRDEARQKEYLHTMISESQRLTRLVNNVLDFSRLEQGRKKYRFEKLDLVELTRDVLTAQSARLEEAGLKPELIGGDGGCEVVGDRDALGQIVLNLIDNAIKYGGAGGKLTLAFGHAEGRCTATVTDAGPGVPPAHRDRIFEQFHRADDSLTADQPGCGLGLSIARRLARDHGGDLTYEPAPGGGARFVLLLPSDLKLGT